MSAQQKEIEEEESEVLDFDNPSFSFIPKGTHDWRQQGFYLVCKSCDLQHAVWVGPNRILVGIDEEGQPILKKRNEV